MGGMGRGYGGSGAGRGTRAGPGPGDTTRAEARPHELPSRVHRGRLPLLGCPGWGVTPGGTAWQLRSPGPRPGPAGNARERVTASGSPRGGWRAQLWIGGCPVPTDPPCPRRPLGLLGLTA